MATDDYAEAIWAGYPKSYTPGRSRPIKISVTHCTAGSEGYTSAEDGASYDKRRTDGTSTHCFHDTDTSLQEVPVRDRAHHARAHGNEIGIGHELCGTYQTREQWLDALSLPMLQRAARMQAEDCYREGWGEPRWLTVDEVRRAYFDPGSVRGGLCTHADVTHAFPEDDGDHEDPGPAFPKDLYIQWAREHYARLAGTTDGESETMRYVFDASWPDRPADLIDPKNPVVIVTSGSGDYRVAAISYQLNNAVTAASGREPVTLKRGAPSDVEGSMPAAWTFAQAFAEVTGGCEYAGRAGLAEWRKAEGAPAGGVTEDRVREMISETKLTPAAAATK